LRLLQFLTAPSVLHDLHELQAERSESGGRAVEFPIRSRRLYKFALERGHLDEALDRVVVAPFKRAAAALDALDRILAGESSRRARKRRR
jgi:NAD(P)H-quinone oxidoreductase subunit 5